MSLTNGSRDLLPSPGPPFEVGKRVAFFPAEIGPTSIWLRLDYAVIVDIDSEAETFGFYFESRPGDRHAQGMEHRAHHAELRRLAGGLGASLRSDWRRASRR